MKIILLFLFFFFVGTTKVMPQNLIPSPEQIKELEGYCEFSDTLVSVYIQDENLVSIPLLRNLIYYNYLNFPVAPWRGYNENRTFNIRDAYVDNPSYHAVQENDSLVWGMTCALWTDYGVTEAMINKRLFPRILALAEQMWHYGGPAPFENFYQRVNIVEMWFAGEGFLFGNAFKEE